VERKKAVIVSSIILFIICIAASLSMGPWSCFTILGKNIFACLDWFANSILLPISGLFITLYVGWFMGKDRVKAEVTNNGTIKFGLFEAWLFLCKFVIPAIIFVVLLSGLGVI